MSDNQQATTENETIVAEITKSWSNEETLKILIGQQFEQCIAVNRNRGYTLKEWKLVNAASQMNGQVIYTETIIAIFEKIPSSDTVKSTEDILLHHLVEFGDTLTLKSKSNIKRLAQEYLQSTIL